MKSAFVRFLGALAPAILIVAVGVAQDRKANPNDPRVGLKAGFRDAGTAIKNMELVSSLPKPDGL